MVARANIRRTRVAVESTFGTDATGSIGNLEDIRITQVDTPREAQEFIEDARTRSKRVLAPASQLGWRRGSLTVGGQLVSTGVEYNAAATPAQDSLSKVFKAIAGGQYSAAGSLVASGASATGVTVTGGEGDNFPEGSLAAVETAVGSGLYVCVPIDTRSTDALTFAHSLGFTPAVNAKVLNCDLIYETDQPATSLQWLCEGEGGAGSRDDIFLYVGCQGNLGITWPLGGEVTWTSSQMFTDRIHDDEIATPQGGAAMSIYTLPGSAPIIARAGSIVFSPTSGTLRTLPGISDFTFDPAITWQEVTSFNGVEGRSGFERVVGQPMASITLPRSEAAETYKDAMEAGTTYRLVAQAGRASGRMLCLYLPTVQIVGIAPVNKNGLEYVTLQLKCLPNATLTDQSTDILRAPWYLGRF